MKKITSKTFYVAFIILALTFITLLIVMPTYSTYAESEEPTEEITEITQENTEKDDKINALIGKANEIMNTAKGIWETKILPAIISSAVSAIVTGVLAIFCGRGKKKWKNAYNQCATAYNEQKEELKFYKEQFEELKNDITNLTGVIVEIKKDIEGTKLEVAQNTKNLENIKQGANQAWAECPDAIRQLNGGTDDKK